MRLARSNAAADGHDLRVCQPGEGAGKPSLKDAPRNRNGAY